MNKYERIYRKDGIAAVAAAARADGPVPPPPLTKRGMKLKPIFVEFTPPRRVPPGVICVAMTHGIATLQCPCGCGDPHMVTRANWLITRIGDSVSIHPSIRIGGSCGSHYLITESHVVWIGGVVKGKA